jgi:FkbM family methyltransferase
MDIFGNVERWVSIPKPWGLVNIGVVDVGARGGPSAAWANLANQVDYTCFEPDVDEVASLKLISSSWGCRSVSIISKALGDCDEDAILHLCTFRPCSSLFEPNLNKLKQYLVADWFLVEKKIHVPLVPLDQVDESRAISADYLKVDVQGAELDVLRGGQQLLARVSVCELEVSFLEIYKNQPLFSEVDTYMREQGFVLVDLERIWWKRKDVPLELQVRGQLAYGDATYVRRDFEFPETRELALKRVLIALALSRDDWASTLAQHGVGQGWWSDAECISLTLWIKRRRRLWIGMMIVAGVLQKMPGRQTLSRWLGLISHVLSGRLNMDGDGHSWNRRTHW